MKTVPFTLNSQVVIELWKFILPQFDGNLDKNQELINASVDNQIFPLTLMAEHKMKKFVLSAIGDFYSSILYDENKELKGGWMNTQFSLQMSLGSYYECTFTKEDAQRMKTDLHGLFTRSLPLIQIAFPFLFTIELKENKVDDTVFFSATKRLI